MIGEILEALGLELKALTENDGITVLRDTQFKDEDMQSYMVPLLIYRPVDSPDFKQLIGGSTQAEWNINISVYFYDFGAEITDGDNFSADAYNLVDTVRRHFAIGQFLNQDFIDLVQNYTFKMTLNGTPEASKLETSDGVIPGFSINYNTIAIDTGTSSTSYSDAVLEKSYQVPIDETEISVSVDHTSFSIAKAAGSHAHLNITSNTPWVLRTSATWLTLSNDNNNVNEEVIITATLNPMTSARVGTVILESPLTEIADITITISQAG